MPELPEVETVCAGLRPVLEGQRLIEVQQRRPDLRFPFPEGFVKRTQGRLIERIDRRSKYILMHMDGPDVLLAHLGMSGRMTITEDVTSAFDRHDHMVLTTERGQQVRFNDARRFGFVDLLPADDLDSSKYLCVLGPEPLGNAFNGPYLADALKSKGNSIKAALLDQSIVAGLGNIYVSEALYEAGISPRRKAGSVQGQRAERLAQEIRAVLTRAIAAGGSSLKDYRQADGELGYFQHAWKVYGREGEACRNCGATVQRIVQSARATFFCTNCQR